MSKNTQAVPMPWFCGPGESSQAFAAFTIYKDLGLNRSMVDAARALGHHDPEMYARQLRKWSSKYSWTERTRAWDNHLAGIAQEADELAVRQMRKRHADLAMSMLTKAAAVLEKMKVEKIHPREAINMVKVGANLERISRGEATELISDVTDKPVKDYTDAELAAFIASGEQEH